MFKAINTFYLPNYKTQVMTRYVGNCEKRQQNRKDQFSKFT